MTTESENAESLTELELSVLAFERQRWVYSGAKEARILEVFGWSSTRYYQVLNDLIDRSPAEAHDVLLVRRLRRLRSARKRQRSPRRLGFTLDGPAAE